MKKKTNYWVGGLMLLGLFFILITGWSVFTAGRGVSSVVDPHYYDHGLKYNDTLIERRAAGTMAWNAVLALESRQVTVRLTDGGTGPVTGCRGQITLHMTTEDSRIPVSFELHESAPGVYSLVLPANIEGTVPAELKLGRDSMIFRRNILLNIKSRG